MSTAIGSAGTEQDVQQREEATASEPPSSSYLLERQRRRPAVGATPVGLAAHVALLLLVLADGGVVHHGQVGVLAVPQTREDVLGEKRSRA